MLCAWRALLLRSWAWFDRAASAVEYCETSILVVVRLDGRSLSLRGLSEDHAAATDARGLLTLPLSPLYRAPDLCHCGPKAHQRHRRRRCCHQHARCHRLHASDCTNADAQQGCVPAQDIQASHSRSATLASPYKRPSLEGQAIAQVDLHEAWSWQRRAQQLWSCDRAASWWRSPEEDPHCGLRARRAWNASGGTNRV